jgi:hypothetical protein
MSSIVKLKEIQRHMHSSVKRNNRCLFHALLLLAVKCAVGRMPLFLDRRSKFHELIRNRLIRRFQDGNQAARVGLVKVGEEGNGFASLACSTGSVFLSVCERKSQKKFKLTGQSDERSLQW